jgi:DNA-binding beta-propeller fold protein YncE
VGGAPGRPGASGVVPGAEGRKLYVVNQSGATISVIDETRLAVDTVLDLRTMGFTANAKPHHVVVEDDGRFWYASLIGDGRVLKFDRANRLVGQVATETPGLLTIDPVHDALYVGRSMTAVNPPRSLAVIRRSDFTLVEEQEILIPRPHALAASLDGRWVHAGSLGENRIASVETATGRVTLASLPGPPHSLVQFAVSPDGRTMIAGGELSNEVFVFDLTRPPPLAPVRTIRVAGKPWEPRFLDDRRAVITLLSRNAVAELDVTAGTVTRVLEGRMAQPYAMVLSRDGRRAYVVSQNSTPVIEGHSGHEMHGMSGMSDKDGWLTVLDLATGQVVTTIMLGNGPTGMGAAGAR